MKSKENVLVIIDPQNDFVDIAGAALPVAGASQDLHRVARFIMKNMATIGKVVITLDSHRVIDISHPSGWVDENGKQVDMKGLIPISHQDVLDGKYSWSHNPSWALEYTSKLEASGSKLLQHFLWPEHCIIGSWGHNVYQPLADAIHAWERECGGIGGAEYVTKGSNPMTEHFGAFQAQVPIDNQPGTQPRIALLKELKEAKNLFLCGEARSHCIMASTQQMLDLAPELAPKMVILTDCMSDVPNPAPGVDFSQNFKPIADRGAAMGMRFAKSTDPIGQFVPATV